MIDFALLMFSFSFFANCDGGYYRFVRIDRRFYFSFALIWTRCIWMAFACLLVFCVRFKCRMSKNRYWLVRAKIAFFMEKWVDANANKRGTTTKNHFKWDFVSNKVSPMQLLCLLPATHTSIFYMHLKYTVASSFVHR